jgi:hypothetical protein
MPEANATRLTISWSKDTDLALRSHLGSLGLKKGAISEFVEDAVKWRLFHQTVGEVRQSFAKTPLKDLDGLLNEAVKDARKPRRSPAPTRSRK